MYRTRSRAKSEALTAEKIAEAEPPSKNATRKGLKKGFVVLTRIDSESLSNSLAGESDKNPADKKSDKPEVKTAKAGRRTKRDGKENLEQDDPPVQAKATRGAAKSKKADAAKKNEAKAADATSRASRSDKVIARPTRRAASEVKVDVAVPTSRRRRSKSVEVGPAVVQDPAKSEKAATVRRGRRKEVPVIEEAAKESKEASEAQAAPARRGRNKKVTAVVDQAATESKEVASSATATKPPARRGRPKKVPVVDEAAKETEEVSSALTTKAIPEVPAKKSRRNQTKKANAQPEPIPTTEAAVSASQTSQKSIKSSPVPAVNLTSKVSSRRVCLPPPRYRHELQTISKAQSISKKAVASQEFVPKQDKKAEKTAKTVDKPAAVEVAPSAASPAKTAIKPAKKRAVEPSATSSKDTSNVAAIENIQKRRKLPEISKTSAPKLCSKNDIREKSAAEPEEDPYSFDLSQSEPAVGKQKNTAKAKKRTAKPKPGNKIELLMQKKKLEAVGSSCNVQQNRVRYEAERSQLQKQLDVAIPSTSKFNVEHQTVRHSPITQMKVVHSPKAVLPPATESPQPFVSDSPPIQSKYALQMAAIAQKQTAKSTPYRVNGKLPSTFYMSLSGNDCTPSFSSDLVEKGSDKTEPPQPIASKEVAAPTEEIAEVHQETRSILEDSNAENVAPANEPRKVKQNQKGLQLRSPLKALSISSLAQVPPTITLRKNVKKPLAVVNESLDFDESDRPERESLDLQISSDDFGFDELLEKERQPGPLAGPSTSKEDYRAKVECIKKYLPSKNNKSRDKQVFPTSPVKRIQLLHSPRKTLTTNLRQFMVSTPFSARATASATFTGSPDISKVNECAETFDEASDVQLFDEHQDSTAHRSYSRPKRPPGFLRRIEESDSDDDNDETSPVTKAPTRLKRKKFNIEETGEFKKFVIDKSTEFAEVDDYQMVIE